MICAWVGVLDTPPGTVRRQPFDVSFSFHHGVLGSRPACQLCTGSAFFTRTQLPSSLFKWNNLGQCQHVASTLEHSPLQTCSHGQSTVSTVQVTGSSKHCPGPLLPQSAPQTHFHSRERGVPWQERSLVDCALVAGIFCSSVSVSSQLLRVN